jgi:hypothetical protein
MAADRMHPPYFVFSKPPPMLFPKRSCIFAHALSNGADRRVVGRASTMPSRSGASITPSD